MITLAEGEQFFPGLSGDTAAGLLDAAEAAGLDPSVVRTVTLDGGGYIVPAAVADPWPYPDDDDPDDGEPDEHPDGGSVPAEDATTDQPDNDDGTPPPDPQTAPDEEPT